MRLQQRHLQRVEAQDAEAAEVALKEQAMSRGRDGAHAQEETAKQELPVTCIAVSAGMSVVIDVSVERHIGGGWGVRWTARDKFWNTVRHGGTCIR